MELNKKRCATYWSYILKLAMLGILLSNHGYKARQAHYEKTIETSVYALFVSFLSGTMIRGTLVVGLKSP